MIPRERVELTEHEVVVARGHEKVIWFVRHANNWVAAAAFEGVELLDVKAGAGVVWDRRLVLMLQTGTELMRVEVRPRSGVPKDPMQYLRGEVRGMSRHTRRTYYVVGRGGVLTRTT